MPEKISDIDVLILCGGQGTRFREVREDIPKALAPIKGIPFIDLLLDDLTTQGFSRIILATGHRGDQVEKYLMQRTDAEYVFSNETKPLGTAGAIKYAENKFRSEHVLVLNGDSRIVFDFHSLFEFHKHKHANMSILLSSTTKGKDYGNVLLDRDNRITTFSEKPIDTTYAYVNAGIYVINLSMLKYLQQEKQYSLEKDCLPYWIQQKKIFGMLTENQVCDIGTPERYNIFCKLSLFLILLTSKFYHVLSFCLI